MPDLFSSLFFPNQTIEEHQKPINSSPLILKHQGKSSLTYGSEVPVGLQHYIFVEILLERIQQNPLFPSKVNMHIIIGHCILKYPTHVYNRKHDTDNTVNA